jgi:hypothetical protein
MVHPRFIHGSSMVHSSKVAGRIGGNKKREFSNSSGSDRFVVVRLN